MVFEPGPCRADEYLADAKAAEEQATRTSDLQIREGFVEIARAYRRMAERAQNVFDDDDTTYEPKSP